MFVRGSVEDSIHRPAVDGTRLPSTPTTSVSSGLGVGDSLRGTGAKDWGEPWDSDVLGRRIQRMMSRLGDWKSCSGGQMVILYILCCPHIGKVL